MFRDRVLAVVARIPRGQMLTYQEVAQRAGNDRAYRAVGNILRENRDLKIPCHRVIHSDNRLGQYNQGVSNKARMLKDEGAI